MRKKARDLRIDITPVQSYMAQIVDNETEEVLYTGTDFATIEQAKETAVRNISKFRK